MEEEKKKITEAPSGVAAEVAEERAQAADNRAQAASEGVGRAIADAAADSQIESLSEKTGERLAEKPKHSFSMFADAMDKAIEKGREAREKNLSERRAWLNDRDTIGSYGPDSQFSMYALRDYEKLTGHEHPKAKLIIEDIKRLRPYDPLDESWRMFDALREVYRDIDAEREKREAEREKREARGEQRRAELMERLEPANHEMGIDNNPHKRQGFEE